MAKRMSFSATGDALIMKHLPQDYPGFFPLKNFIGKAEARMTNLETTLTDGSCYPSAFSGGTWLTTDPSVLKDLKDFGFNLYGWANNHTLDYSYDGLISTSKALDDAGLVHAGAGMNLYEASRPAMIDLPSGRVAFISICSTFDASAPAGIQGNTMPGRPGLNPLRYSTVHRITSEQMAALKDIARVTAINARSENSVRQGFKKAPPEGTYEFAGSLFSEVEDAAGTGRISVASPKDVARTVHDIQDALRTCDYVVVMAHSHEIKGTSNEYADYFLEEFAHACIDAGACAVIGGGTHQMKGIELYKGKPVFYSLGNFIFQNEYVRRLPPDFMEKHGLPLASSAAEGIAGRTANATGTSMHATQENFFSIVPLFEFTDDTCTSLLLQPVDLGLDRDPYFRNLPYPADSGKAREILTYLERISIHYGTRLTLRDDLLIEVKL